MNPPRLGCDILKPGVAGREDRAKEPGGDRYYDDAAVDDGDSLGAADGCTGRGARR